MRSQGRVLDIRRVSKPITVLVNIRLLKVNLNSTAVTVTSRGE
jgi:hypothetical protein